MAQTRQQKTIPDYAPQTKRSRGLRIAGVAMFSTILAFVAVNTILAASLTGVVYPGVSIAGHNVGLKTRAQATTELKRYSDQHTLTIQLADKSYVMKSNELGATRDVSATVDSAYSVGRSTPWPVFGVVASLRDGRASYAYNLDTKKLDVFVSKVLADIGRPPVNAHVEVVDGKVVAVADQDGVSIDQAQLGHTLQQALAEGQDKSVALNPATVKADIQLSATEPVIAKANQLIASDLSLSYEGNLYRPSTSTIASWLVFPEKPNQKGVAALQVDIDEAKLRGYIQSVANEVNVAPTNKKVTIKNGVSATDQEGKDGLAINQDEAVKAFLDALHRHGSANVALTTSPVAFKTEYNRITTLDGVARYIEINLSVQHLWVYQDSQVIYESPITSGAAGVNPKFATVTGLFSIYGKSRNTHLIGNQYGADYNYDVLVDYWMPFYGGFGLHDAWRWRSSYGGPDYYYNGSHGCVNLPLETAAFIYNWAEIGTPVWVHT